MLVMAILLLGIFSRLVIHLPNFTPVMALALFGGVYLSARRALWVPVVLMAVSDLFLGLHATVLFTWGSVLLISLLGRYLRGRKNWLNVFGAGLLASVLFFVVTNFGAWLVMYPRTASGFAECYIAAIPFFRNMLASTWIYSVVFFGVYETLAHTLKSNERAAWLLKA